MELVEAILEDESRSGLTGIDEGEAASLAPGRCWARCRSDKSIC